MDIARVVSDGRRRLCLLLKQTVDRLTVAGRRDTPVNIEVRGGRAGSGRRGRGAGAGARAPSMR